MTTVNNLEKDADAFYKKAVREQLIYTRSAAKRIQQNLKQQLKEDNINAVNSYNEYLKCLRSVHKDCGETINWEHLSQKPHPKLPLRQSLKQFEAEYNYQTYEPSFIDFVFMQNRHKIRELLDKVEVAIQADDLIYNTILKEFKADASDWKKIQSITKGVREADPSAYKSAVNFFDPFLSISHLGPVINCEFFTDCITVNVNFNSNKVIPDYVLSETDSGKLSSKKMEVPMYNDLCQDYIFKVVLRIARETFALLPISFVIVNVLADVFNSAKSQKENSNILSINFDADRFKQLSFQTLNCSNCISTFKHNIEFTKASGFSATPILTDQRDLSAIL